MPHQTKFGTLAIEYDDGVLAPRPWTTLQSEWAAQLLERWPEGEVLELCAGAGQIGLLAVALAPRRLVAVDGSPTACRWARRNAEAAGLADLVEVREGRLDEALRAGERFGVVIADPPWVPSEETDRFPEDPRSAIDGGPDGLDGARACVRVAAAHLLPGAAILLQLGSRQQADALAAELDGLTLDEVREGEGGVVALLTRA